MGKLGNLKKKIKNNRPIKMSEIISHFAADIMSGGNDIFQKQNYLNCACTAWNIALHPKGKIEEQLNMVIADYIRNNPAANDSDSYKHNLKQLIERKTELYPYIKKIIIEATIEEVNGKNQITVASMNVQK